MELTQCGGFRSLENFRTGAGFVKGFLACGRE